MNWDIKEELALCFIILVTVLILSPTIAVRTVFAQESLLDKIEFITSSSSSSPSKLALSLLIIIFITSSGWLIWNLRYRTRKRKSFTAETRRQALRNQRFRCGICRINAGIWDYDHKDGNRANNSKSNCLVLCPTCHAKKSRQLIKMEARSRGKNIYITVGLGMLVILILYSIM